MVVSVGLAGSITILFLVAFGIFLYPWLLKRRGGLLVAGALTVLLAALFYLFDQPLGPEASPSATLAVIWALLPLVTGFIVKRLQTKATSSPSGN
jgi:apolipoprotein N-acyltransferase